MLVPQTGLVCLLQNPVLCLSNPPTCLKGGCPSTSLPYLIAPTPALPEAVLPQTQGKSACLIFHTIHEGWFHLRVLNQYSQLTVPPPQQAPVIDVRRALGGCRIHCVCLSPKGRPLTPSLLQNTCWWATHLLGLHPQLGFHGSLCHLPPFHCPWLGPAPPPPTPLAARGPDPALTNDDYPVICNEHLAVDIDKL